MSDTWYTSTHVWVRLEHNGECTVGLTPRLTSDLGEVIFVELAEVGAVLVAGQQACVVESTKTVIEMAAPISGEVIAVNAILAQTPKALSDDPLGMGWMFKVQPSPIFDPEGLLDEGAYGTLNP